MAIAGPSIIDVTHDVFSQFDNLFGVHPSGPHFGGNARAGLHHQWLTFCHAVENHVKNCFYGPTPHLARTFFDEMNKAVREMDRRHGDIKLCQIAALDHFVTSLENLINPPHLHGVVAHAQPFGLPLPPHPLKQKRRGLPIYDIILYRVLDMFGLVGWDANDPHDAEHARTCILKNRNGANQKVKVVKRIIKAWRNRNELLLAMTSAHLPPHWIFFSHWILLNDAFNNGYNMTLAQRRQNCYKVACILKVHLEHTKISGSGNINNVPQLYLDFVAEATAALTAIIHKPKYATIIHEFTQLARMWLQLRKNFFKNL